MTWGAGDDWNRASPSEAELERSRRRGEVQGQLDKVRAELQAVEREAWGGSARRLFRRRWLQHRERELEEALTRLRR